MKRTVLMALLCAITAAAQSYTKEGELVLPKDYRSWVFLASSIAMNYPELGPPRGDPAFDNVFVNPKAHQAYLKTGSWPDKTILLLEVRQSGSQPNLDSNARFQAGVIGIEAHVKDLSHGGWMFYAIRLDTGTGKPLDKTEKCYSCHEKNAAVDTTFVQYYPTLIDAAKQHGTYKAAAE